MSEQIGPTLHRINRVEKRCGGCKYHLQARPRFRHLCRYDRQKSVVIGTDDLTPDWCPVEKSKSV